MTKGNWAAWAGALLTTAGGCALVAGIDKDYHPLGEGGAGTSASSGSGGASGTGMPNVCTGGDCMGVCKPGDKQCLGNGPQGCDEKGQWQNGAACSEATPGCIAGECKVPPSCVGLPSTCGPSETDGCCVSPIVLGGTYIRSNDASFPATVSDFRLDKFEVTVGRFRKFVETYSEIIPKLGAKDGAHPRIAGSGWDAAWIGSLPLDPEKLKEAVSCDWTHQTWTDTPGGNENLPINCISWYVAFAFCAWDGGRLPTEAEWNYAAAGGSEQREYPWGSTPPDESHAVFQPDPPAGVPPGVVGSKPAGNGKWLQADLAGNIQEWNLDWRWDPYPMIPCNDCASVEPPPIPTPSRVSRGGSWKYGKEDLLSSVRFSSAPTDGFADFGARCARNP
jgi:formylglycine-generating enzyme